MLRRAICKLLLLALVGCSSAPTAPLPADAVDPDLVSGWRLARFAFERGQHEQAADLYERVLERAYARDDLGAIADVGYELAVVRLRAGEHAGAAAEARRVREELARRGQRPPADLHLVEAVALYGASDAEGALSAAAAALELAGPDDALLVGRAEYVRGAVAADRGDADGLEQAIARLGGAAAPEPQADRLELLGRLRLIERRPGAAVLNLRESADLRREVGDYVGMARALAFAAEAAAADGQTAEAADLYFRAGRSAAVEGRDAEARRWLQEAARLARIAGHLEIERETDEILDGL